jgi:hypothetical protein
VPVVARSTLEKLLTSRFSVTTVPEPRTVLTLTLFPKFTLHAKMLDSKAANTRMNEVRFFIGYLPV